MIEIRIYLIITRGVIPRVIPRPVRTLVVGIFWCNFTYSGKLTIEATAYYEIATGAVHPHNDTWFGSILNTIKNYLSVY